MAWFCKNFDYPVPESGINMCILDGKGKLMGYTNLNSSVWQEFGAEEYKNLSELRIPITNSGIPSRLWFNYGLLDHTYLNFPPGIHQAGGNLLFRPKAFILGLSPYDVGKLKRYGIQLIGCCEALLDQIESLKQSIASSAPSP